MDLVGKTKSKSVQKTRIIPHSPVLGVLFPIGSFLLAYGMLLATFQREVLSIFTELLHDAVEIYMDDFTPYGYDFQEAFTKLRKLLHKCIEMKLSDNPKKCEFLMTEGTVLDHSIS